MNDAAYQSVTFRITDGDNLDNRQLLERLLRTIATQVQLQVLEMAGYSFNPQGHSLVLILAESHLAIHTWPETKSAYITLVSCRQLPLDNLNRVQDLIGQTLNTKLITYKEVKI